MKRLAAIVVVALVVLSVTYSGGGVEAQDGAEATIEAQETEIAEIRATSQARGEKINAQRTQIAELKAGPTETRQPEQVEGGESSQYLFGPGVELLPGGNAGEVSVVAQGAYNGNILPIVVQNNTDGPIWTVTISSSVRSAAGELIGAGGDQGFDPTKVESGSFAIGYLYFDGATLPADATFEFDVSYESSEGRFLSTLDMAVVEASFLGDRIVGEFRNEHDVVMSGPINIAVLCVGADGQILTHEQGYTDDDEAQPGESIPFQVTLYGGVDCTNFIVAGGGYNF